MIVLKVAYNNKHLFLIFSNQILRNIVNIFNLEQSLGEHKTTNEDCKE